LSESQPRRWGHAKAFVGIDVAKDTSSAQGIDSTGNGKFSLTFTMDSEGFMELWKAIAAHSKDLTAVMAAVESTACYHINLYSFLTAKGVSTVVINPCSSPTSASFPCERPRPTRKTP